MSQSRKQFERGKQMTKKKLYQNLPRLHSLAEKPLYIEQFIVAHVEQILTDCVCLSLSPSVCVRAVVLFCFVLLALIVHGINKQAKTTTKRQHQTAFHLAWSCVVLR